MYWLNRLLRKGKTERQLDSELQFHLEQQIADYVQAGMNPDDARRRAKIEFGGMEGVKEQCRESRRVHLIETLIQDARYGLRMMQKSPAFTLVAVLTLTLGIGANTAIFSVVNGVLLNPLPFPHSEQLITLHESRPNFKKGAVSYPNFVDWQKENRTFSAMAVARGYTFSLTGMGDAEQVKGQFITSDFFSLLGVSPILGRPFAAGEDEIGKAPIALISAGLWQRKFGGTRDVLGKNITLDGRDYTIVGVMPADFSVDAAYFQPRDVYLPIGQWNNSLLQNRVAGLGIHPIGRLKPGVSLQQAQADMDCITTNLAAAYPDANKGTGASLIPLKEQIVGPVQPYLVVMLAAVGFVLLIACVNVANLLLARATHREREFAVRIALGASKTRIMRQLLTESVLLAVAGGVLGLFLAGWGTQAMLKLLPDALPRANEVRLDSNVLIFTILASLVSGILFGLVPALKISRPDLLVRMKEGGRGVSRTRNRVQNIFVVAELAMALVLLAGSGLMLRCLARLWSVDPGFNPKNVLTFSISLAPPMMKASPEAIRAAFRQLDTTLASVPGVQATSVSWGAFPLQGDDEELFWMEGQPKPATQHDMSWAVSYVVGPDYLKAMGIPLLRGRFLEAQDDEHAPRVAVVDEEFATKFFPNQDPIGRRIKLNRDDGARPVQVVGVVKHVKQWGLGADDQQMLRTEIYRPFMQLPDDAMALAPSGTGIVVRSQKEPAGLFDSIRSVLHQVNHEQVVFVPESMEEIISDSLATRRYFMILLGLFAALALVLAGVGIYGLISYIVGQRTNEIGIRMALGARRIHVLGLVMGQGIVLTLIGIAAGIAAALLLTRLMESLLFGVSATDPLTFLCVAALLMLLGLLACAVPARRAMRVDPLKALRYE